jgi:hypothetical protein
MREAAAEAAAEEADAKREADLLRLLPVPPHRALQVLKELPLLRTPRVCDRWGWRGGERRGGGEGGHL